MIDRFSPTWLAVKDNAEKLLTTARGQIEAAGTSLEHTEFLRGRIAAAKDILKMADPAPPVTLPPSSSDT